jgi:signal peptidase I
MTRSLATIGTRARALATVAGRGLMAVLLLSALAAVAVTFLPGLMGYQRYVLVGSSMEPTIHRGSLVFDEVVPVAQLRKGDVITYVPPGRTQPVTHRLISVAHPKKLHGRALFRTQGDNVAAPDMRAFTLDRPTQARYSFAVPYLGWVFVALGTPQMRLFLLVVPALLIALAMVARLWREGGRLAAQRAQLAATAEHEAG